MEATRHGKEDTGPRAVSGRDTGPRPKRDSSLLAVPGGADCGEPLMPSLLPHTPAEYFISLKKQSTQDFFFFLLLAKMETYPHALKKNKKKLRALKESNPRELGNSRGGLTAW